ncbi:MAG: efflux RND transporter periplasmic adaptor subunit [Syntrophobacteraceae bacterium]
MRNAALSGIVISRRGGFSLRCVFLASTVFILLVLSMTAGCGKHDEKKPAAEQRIEVTTVTVTPKDTPVTFESIAQTQSSRQVNIQARVEGFLEKRVYTEGQIVKEGQALFLMDQKPFKAQLNLALAALAQQEAALATAKANLARVKPLTQLNALSQKDLDDATGQFQGAAATVEQAKAQVETARLNLSYTVINAPVTGITSYAVQADGTYLNAQNSLLTTVAVLTPMWVNFSVSENEWLKLNDQARKGLLRLPEGHNYTVELVLVDGSIFPHTGKLTFAEPSFNSQTGTFMVRANVDNPKGVLRPNQYVRVRLKGASRPDAILVPQRAVQQGPKGHFVWVVDKDNKATVRPVDVGEWYETDWFIDEGLHAGDQVVVDGALLLRPGSQVTIKSAATAPATAPAQAAPKAEAAKTDNAKGGK